MKYLYSWLKEFYPNTPNLTALEPLLIQLGHDVSSITPITYNGVIVVEVTDVKPHPNSNRLSLVTVTDGSETRTVVCGAPNVRPGMRVPYAQVGATLPCGLTIRKAKIRDVESEGMLCAEDELGIGPSHEGLLTLPDHAIVGQPITAYVPEEAIIDLDITPNRGDVLSHFGLARDIKVGNEQQLLIAEFLTPNVTGTSADELKIGAVHADAPHFTLALATHTAEKQPMTPLIMQSRLCMLGQKSINLAADITNYLMLAYGQPLHAYDGGMLGERPVIGVRRAHDGETFQGINETKLTLTPQSLVITNHDTPIGLAGILGGEASKTTPTSSTVVFEAALFNRKAISLAARGLRLFTDSSVRFDRGVDPSLQLAVLNHALALWQNITGGSVFAPLEHMSETSDRNTANVQLSVEDATRFIGTPISTTQLEEILTALGCTVLPADDTVTVTPASWRYDLHFREDYFEELARVIGLHNLLKKALPASVPQWKRSSYWRHEYLKDILAALGGYEISTYPFTSTSDEEKFGNPEIAHKLITIPIEGKPRMRTTLIPGALQAIAENPETPFLAFFEIARVYLPDAEPNHLVVAVSGNAESTIYDWWQNLFERLRLPVSSWMSRVKTIDDATRNEYKIRKNVTTVLEIAVDDLPLMQQHDIFPVTMPDLDTIDYAPLSRFQASRRDIAFVIGTEHNPDEILKQIRDLDDAIIEVELFDIYRNQEKLGANKQSIALRIVYQSTEKTLTTEEIQHLHSKVENYIKEQYHAAIR